MHVNTLCSIYLDGGCSTNFARSLLYWSFDPKRWGGNPCKRFSLEKQFQDAVTLLMLILVLQTNARPAQVFQQALFFDHRPLGTGNKSSGPGWPRIQSTCTE